ncbi:uncharacterized protein LACBIDRAFT_333487 [Laccaria bicolor S238N-H82]|uniref:Predicted protein n=1 Tax=Laccaria bicolor (strain S238N-H82 / ATCC MYA-4686) TaxID=486041 RepID=B0DW27_LACBS|nr:uncharacterized protein LACBIDRAFT_333487 [Laccaria bicolor S238N-H82]EDR01239.1 predicted protein [Laccaria bicolor S238N-H82]|eukprot:XP_001888115.1 predicted protein [Laccaria bicolor S238N-H82]
MANVNSSAFGHAVQNNSSHTLKELFGVKRHEDPLGSNVPRGTANFEPRLVRKSQGEDNSQETVFSNNRAKEAGTQEIQTAMTAMMGKGITVHAEDPGNLSHQVTHEKTRLVPFQEKETQSIQTISQSIETHDRIEQDWNTPQVATTFIIKPRHLPVELPFIGISFTGLGVFIAFFIINGIFGAFIAFFIINPV